MAVLIVAGSVAACGGGGGGAPANTQQPPPPSRTIGGVVMLGPVANADVELRGTSGVLGSGSTATDGSFGPISYSGSYSGPLRITVTGNAASTWICDFFIGCGSGSTFYQPGQSIEFDGTLEAVLPTATNGQFVSVSLLSNFAAERVDVLGGLTSANVNSANADIADTIRSVLGNTINNMSLVLPDNFSSIELFDLQNLPAPGGANDALGVLLTLLNSGLMGLPEFPQTTGQFIDLISNDIATQPMLSVSDPNFFAASQESLITVFLVQAIDIFDVGGARAASIEALLSPADLVFVLNNTFDTYLAMPALDLGTFDLDVFVDDLALQGAISRDVEVFTNTGALLQPGDYGVNVFPIDGGDWLSAAPVSIGGISHVRLNFNNGLIRTLPNGTYEAFVETYSATGDFRRHDLSVWLTLTVAGNVFIADVSLPDPVLQQCIDDAAAAGNLVEVIELTTLSCAGVSDATGLDIFFGITSLDLAGNTLTSLQPILALANLQFLDISGNPSLPCEEIDILAQRLVEGTELIVDDTCRGSVALDLGASGFDAALDEVRNQIYVSIPDRNEIAVISLSEHRIVDRLLMPGIPNGIDVSIDGTRLFAALNGSNAVAVVDIDQRTVSTIDLGVSTDHPTTYDVVEGEPDRLFVSANPGSGGLSYVAQVRLDQGNISSRVANNTFIRSRPVLARSPDQQFVYVGSGFSPNSLYKLSLLDPDAPIVLEDDHGSVGGTDNLALNPSGTRIALGSGQVLRTGSFIEDGRVPSGRSVGSNLTDTLFVAGPNGLIESFDFTTLVQAGSRTTYCDNGTTSRILAYDGDQSFMLLQFDRVCLNATVSRTMPPDPFAALRFADLALEECVIDAATAFGYTQPEEFTALDCSATLKTILSLEGIYRLSNLQLLDLSNSGVIDLSPLAPLTSLQSLTVRNAKISDIGALFSIGTLTSADLTGNPGVRCTDLDQLVATGVAVQADQCTDTVRVELGGIGHDMEYDAVGNRVFVSIPSLNRISEVNLGTASIVQNFTLSGQPRGIDLSSDMQTIYAALNGVGDMAVVDSANGNTEVIDISVELDDDRTWDVAEISTDRVVVSTNPGSNGFGYIVEVRRDLGNAATRVADNTIIRASPIFEVSPDQTAVYVGSGFSPNSLYKLDATQANLPIILEDDHGEVSGTASLALNPDGSRIYLLFGQVLSTDTFTQVAQFPAGRSVVSQDGTKLLVGDVDTDSARVYDITTTGQVGNRHWGCDLLNLEVITEFGDGVLALGDDLVCYSRTVPYP